MTGVSVGQRRRTAGLRRLAAVALAAAMLLGASVGGPVADASASCGMPVAAEVVAWADVIVVGRITEVDDPGASYSPHPVSWTVEVATVHRGQAPRVLHVASDSDAMPSTGVYVLPLVVQEGRLVGDGCALSGTGPGLDSDLARGILAAAGPGHAPADGDAATALPGYAPVDLGSGWSPAGVVFALMGAALALALLVAAVGGLRRARVEARARGVAMSRSAR
ncbi:hypothetical protein [Intrasporangium sp. YIM S08009]|uniref:hypothetical protein n=1 Tax=Intrasporangium zincisolvens TaxID=3080018 RepID=UPI002B0540B9|nr:hypothetical protein [Intrasporangium sp. YIM S08009]